MKKTSSSQNSLIWFGAAVSIAEILTGTYFAPLGFTKGLLAILVGHVIGCAMFFFASSVTMASLWCVECASTCAMAASRLSTTQTARI